MVDFDFLLSITVSHDCNEESIRTSVEGITVSPPRHGVAVLAAFEGNFCGICSTCGQEILVSTPDLAKHLA